jgi:hypothetical protein
MTAHLRAAHHLSLCQQCAAEIDVQTQARTALRDSLPVNIPSGLLGLLAQIPESTPDEPISQAPTLDDPLADGSTRQRRKRR